MNCLCRRPDIIPDHTRGEVVCGGCGTVLEYNMAERPDIPARLEEGRDDWGVGTLLPNTAGGAQSVAARRNSQNAALSRLFVRVRQMLESVRAGDAIRNEAYSICRRMIRQNKVGGRDRAVVAAAILMLACRIHGRVLEWDQIPGISKKVRRTRRMYRDIQEQAYLDPAIYTRSVISRLGSEIDASICMTRRALNVLDTMRGCNFTHGKKPQCLAATAMVLAGVPTSKREVARAAGISEPGLRCTLAAWGRYRP